MRTLRMRFATNEGRTHTLSLNYPRADVSAPEVESAMDAILDEDFLAEGLASPVGADIVDRTVTVLF